MTLSGLQQIEQAARVVASAMKPTPEICWATLSTQYRALGEAREPYAGRRVGLVLSGGNVDRAKYARILANRTVVKTTVKNKIR